MRRSSTALSLQLPGRSGSATPPPPDSETVSLAGSVSGKPDRDDPGAALSKLHAVPQPAVSTPTPIPESPAREAAALAADSAAKKDPSPLSRAAITAEAESRQGSTALPSDSQDPLISGELVTTPPDVSTTANQATETKQDIPPVLTDEPEEIPSAQPVPPSAPRSKSPTPPPRASAPPTAPSTPPPQPAATRGYFDIPRSAMGNTAADGDNVANIWADQQPLAGAITSSPDNLSNAPDRAVTHKQSNTSIRRPGSASSYGGAPALQSRKPSRGSFQHREQELAGSTYTWSNSSSAGFGQTRVPSKSVSLNSYRTQQLS